MARSITYWYDLMITEKTTFANLSVYQPAIDDSQTLLNDLTSTSIVSRWRLVFWVVAACAYAMDVVFDLAILTLQTIAASSRYGTLPWYVSIAKEFQYGDSLSLINLEWKYAIVNPANQIIKLAAAQEGPGIVNLKVAKLVGTIKQPLIAAEYTAAKAYFNQRKPAGIKLNLISDNPDDLILDISINYDPLVLTATGELISTPGTFPVNDAIESYLESLDFNGAYELMKQIDFIQSALGPASSAYINSASARYGVNPFIPFPQRYFSNAGYLAINTLTISYTPNV